MQFSYNTKLKEVEVGCDEAGRGCLLGPVFAAAVVWDPAIREGLALQIKDSKKLTAKKREILAEYIETNAVAYGVASVDSETIDKINILNASIEAMHKAIEKVANNIDIQLIVVDGNTFKLYVDPSGEFVPHVCVVDGDNKYVSIAAASILAKVYHDRWIKQALIKYPELEKYSIATNQGYGSKKHMDAIKEHGVTSHHRKSFKCCR